MRVLIVITFTFLISDVVGASTCSSAPRGTQKRFGTQMFFCDNPEWIALGDGNSTGDTCTAGQIGIQKFAMDNLLGSVGMIYCDGTNWISLTTGNSPDPSACPAAGQQRYANNSMEYCPSAAGTWKDMKTTSMPSPTVCSVVATQVACDAEKVCYWNAGSCQDCPCKH